ncbi:S-layer homology domain-containing protein [Paenibacillus sp. GCM10027626]|uniref:S-layer homology domain-containing protein n=1 Tax=Paenibacillus sp. GCM10027626 TaxID=3273411 RepID=UPI00362E4BEE
MKRLMYYSAIVTILFTSISTAIGTKASDAAAQTAAVKTFSDVKKGHWAEKDINRMVERGILNGYPDGTFRPSAPVKVDEFIKMLILSYTELHQNGERSWNVQFINSLSVENQTILKQDYRYFDFKSSTTGYWAKPYIDVANDLHFLSKNRYSDFQTDMTRENVAEVLYYTLLETEILEDSQFSSTLAASYGDLMSASDREQKFIAEALVKGIMQGYPNGYFGVGDYVTRSEALVILNRLTDKSQRISIQPKEDQLQRAVAIPGGGQKIISFPDKRMWDAYDSLAKAGKLRGSNHDLFETTLRLFKDQDELERVQAAQKGNGSATEEASIWLDPHYNTYGITIRLREGTLARNQEVIQSFTNDLFGPDALAFRKWFEAVCTEVAAGTPVSSKKTTVGNDTVNILVDSDNKTIMFSIAKKKND